MCDVHTGIGSKGVDTLMTAEVDTLTKSKYFPLSLLENPKEGGPVSDG